MRQRVQSVPAVGSVRRLHGSPIADVCAACSLVARLRRVTKCYDRARWASFAGSSIKRVLPCCRIHPRWLKSDSALLTVSRDEPTSVDQDRGRDVTARLAITRLAESKSGLELAAGHDMSPAVVYNTWPQEEERTCSPQRSCDRLPLLALVASSLSPLWPKHQGQCVPR